MFLSYRGSLIPVIDLIGSYRKWLWKDLPIGFCGLMDWLTVTWTLLKYEWFLQLSTCRCCIYNNDKVIEQSWVYMSDIWFNMYFIDIESMKYTYQYDSYKSPNRIGQ